MLISVSSYSFSKAYAIEKGKGKQKSIAKVKLNGNDPNGYGSLKWGDTPYGKFSSAEFYGVNSACKDLYVKNSKNGSIEYHFYDGKLISVVVRNKVDNDNILKGLLNHYGKEDYVEKSGDVGGEIVNYQWYGDKTDISYYVKKRLYGKKEIKSSSIAYLKHKYPETTGICDSVLDPEKEAEIASIVYTSLGFDRNSDMDSVQNYVQRASEPSETTEEVSYEYTKKGIVLFGAPAETSILYAKEKYIRGINLTFNAKQSGLIKDGLYALLGKPKVIAFDGEVFASEWHSQNISVNMLKLANGSIELLLVKLN